MTPSFSEALSPFRPEDERLSSEEKGQIQRHRLLSLLGAILVPLFGPLQALSNPGAVDPMWARLGIAGLLAGLLGASYLSARIRRNYVGWMRGLLYVLMGWFVVVAALNRFAGGYTSGALLMFMVLILVVGLGARSMGPVLRFSGFGLLLVAGAVVLGVAPRTDALVLLGRMATAALLEGLVIQANLSTRESLREREERLRSITENVSEGIYRSVPGEGLVYANRAFARIFGYDSVDEVLALDPTALYASAEERARLQKTVEEQGDLDGVEVEFQRKDGSTFVGLLSDTIVRGEDGDVKYYVGAIADITKQKEAEQALREERDRFETLFESLPTPVVRCQVREEGNFIADVNKAFEEVFGLEASAVEGTDIDELIVPEEKREEAVEIARSALGEPPQQVEVQRKTADGLRDFQLQVAGRTPEEGIPEVYVIYTDITEQKQREAQLERQNERLDKFASVVSHDLRNPLNVAKGRLGLAQENGDPGHFAAVDRALDRMDEIIQNVLTLTWGGRELASEALEPCRLVDVAERSWEQVETAEATLHVDDDPFVRADESRLQRLLENLFRNAVEHGGEDVTVRVGTLSNGFFVEDDGPGIPPQEREKVLEAGYSSEEGGTGLGLSIVETIAAAHGWSLSVTNGQEGGARFEFTGIERNEEEQG